MRIDKFEYSTSGDLKFTFGEVDWDGFNGRRVCAFHVDADELFHLLHAHVATSRPPVYYTPYYDKSALLEAIDRVDKTNEVPTCVARALRGYVMNLNGATPDDLISVRDLPSMMRRILEPFCDIVDRQDR